MEISRIILVFELIAFAYCELLAEKRDLSVKIGRSVYINPSNLVFRPLSRNVECKVEVVNNDPITQRVGTVEPQIFNCLFPPNSVKYVHNGSPLLSLDSIKLRVYTFTDRETVVETIYLTVNIVNASYDVIQLGPHHLEISDYSGLSSPIDSSIISFVYSASANVSCTVKFSKYKSQWPLAGQMVMGKRQKSVDAIKKDCREFDFLDLRYRHFKSPTPDVDYLPLTVDMYDPTISDVVVTEKFYLPIRIRGAFANSPPRASFMSMYIMDVDQFILTTLIPGVISAEDYETPASQLIFNISRPPSPGNGFLVNLDDHTQVITSFGHDDLENHRIAFQPTNVSYSERRVYEVEFTVFDSHFAHSMPMNLHIAVRPSATDAPRISHNTGLILLEGQSRQICSENLKIVDRDNIKNVKIYVHGGLKYGRLEVNRNPGISFTIKDLQMGRVYYHHDDSDTPRDHIDLRISDGSHTIKATFPITIISKDDSAPYLVNNLGLEISEGGTRRISPNILLSHDTDSLDDTIVFTITVPPSAGHLIKKVRPNNSGHPVREFTQRELTKGQIYYHHSGSEEFRDLIRFTLKDQQDPPNISEEQTIQVFISSKNDNPPQLVQDATRLMYVPETTIAFFTASELAYTDIESNDGDLLYTITSPPYFIYSNGREDAGRIIATHNLTMLMKDKSIPAVFTFKQDEINHRKIAYMPPFNDIGPEPRLVRFVYSVQDTSGNRVLSQHFDIEIHPINNQPPKFVTSKLLVEEGGALSLSTNQLSAIDIDTVMEDLKFYCDSLPKYGALQKNGIAIKKGEEFNIHDLRHETIRYLHDSSEVVLDTFVLSLTDGVHKVSKLITIDIVPVDDEAPRIHDNLSPYLIVSEGGEAIITTSILAAKDEDTDDDSLIFLVVKQPKYGVLQLNGAPTTKFTQKNIQQDLVKFIHTGGEIGPNLVRDAVTFLVSDQNYANPLSLPMYDMNITITPVDNQRPTLHMGNPIFVQEGGKFKLSEDVLTGDDLDTDANSIVIMITAQPQWGYLENITPNPGSEKSNAGNQINNFKLQDIVDGSINYVQSNHLGVEPLYDSMKIYATDGKLNSPTISLSMTVIPQNDEVPDVMLQNFTVPEGGHMIIDRSMIDVIDLDLPRDQVTLSIVEAPEYGYLKIMLQTKSGRIAVPVHDFTLDELHSGIKFKYKHDGSENFEDRFTLLVTDGKHHVKKVCRITVIPVNDERPEITRNAGLMLDFGEVSIISSVVLQSMDEDNDVKEIIFVIVALPRKGVLQHAPGVGPLGDNDIWQNVEIGQNFSQYAINMNRVRYVHTHGMDESEDDKFLFVLSDGANKRQVETFEIRVKNSKKARIAIINNGLNVNEGEVVPIMTDNLSASDDSTKAEEIVFAITHSPQYGQLEYIDRPYVAINSFTQLDLAAHLVVYHHLSKSDITEDTFGFTVTNGLSEAKDGEFFITIKSMDRILPSLVVNRPLEVLQGNDKAISPMILKATDPDTAMQNVTFNIAKSPTYGNLYNRGILIMQSFSQYDIDHGYITYESDSGHAGLDHFLFTVSDGRHHGFLINDTLQEQPVMSSIYIKPLVNDAPKLLVKEHPKSLEAFGKGRYGFILTRKNLQAVDGDTESSHLRYVMTEKPKHGHIENIAAKMYVRRSFSQKDLDDRSLLYIMDKKSPGTNDSFSFRIEDGRGNSLDNQRFDMRWSRIQFTKIDYVVCENIGTLTMTLVRSGALEHSAYVSIRVREMSARTIDDFRPSTAKQIQFDPGMARATWNVQIRDDNIEEPNEKFRLILHDPVNAVLGLNERANIQIINSEDGQCAQYIGMISKENPVSFNGIISVASSTGNKGKIFNFHRINKVQKTKPLKNRLSTKGRLADESIGQTSSAAKKASNQKKTKRHRGKKSRKSKKKSSNQKSKPKKEFNEASKVIIKPPHVCDSGTKDLLHFDEYEQQMYKCDGGVWQKWMPGQSRDEQPQSHLCSQGWSEFRGHCYKFVNDRLTWNSAEKACRDKHSAHLTSIHSSQHLKWLANIAGKNIFWMGLNDKGNTANWVYTNGVKLEYTKWRSGGPKIKRSSHKKNCVFVNKKLKWANKQCDRRKKKFICEKSPKRSMNYRSHKGSKRGRSGFFYGG